MQHSRQFQIPLSLPLSLPPSLVPAASLAYQKMFLYGREGEKTRLQSGRIGAPHPPAGEVAAPAAPRREMAAGGRHDDGTCAFVQGRSD